MKISRKQLSKFRSGQCVWRVIFHARSLPYSFNPADSDKKKDSPYRRMTTNLKDDVPSGVYFYDPYLKTSFHIVPWIHREFFLGKKIRERKTVFSGYQPYKMSAKSLIYRDKDGEEHAEFWKGGMTYVHYVSDAHGQGAFSKKHQAERFAHSVVLGSDPEMIKILIDDASLSNLLDY